MKKQNHSWFAIALFSLLFFGSFVMNEGAHMMFNLIGLTIVIAGTLAAAFLSYPFADLRAACLVAFNSYRTPAPKEEEIVDALLDLSIRSRVDGLLALEKTEGRTSVMFLRRSLELLVDDFKINEMRDILYTEVYFFQQRRGKQERTFRHLARVAPAFGVTGSVIGLIGMLAGIGDTGVIIQTIPIALTSTLYGIVLANFLLIPIAENIHAKTQDELLIHKLIIEGVTLISEEYNTLRLQTKLESFLTPAVRAQQYRSFKEIRDKYNASKKLDVEPMKPVAAE